MPNNIHTSPGSGMRRSRKARTQSLYVNSKPSNNQGDKLLNKTDDSIIDKYLTSAGISPIKEGPLNKEPIAIKLRSDLKRLQSFKQSGTAQVENTKNEINKFFANL